MSAQAPSNSDGGRRPRRLSFWLIVALLVHLELGGAAGLFAYFFAPRDADLVASNLETAEVSFMDDDEARKLAAEIDREIERQKEEEARKEEESSKPGGQVVELPKPLEEERPDDAKFVAEYNSKVARETRKFGELKKDARMASVPGNAKVTTPAQPASKASPAAGGAEAQKKEPSPSALAMRTPPRAPAVPAIPGLGPRQLQGRGPETETAPPDGDGRPLLVPQQEVPTPDSTAGASGPKGLGLPDLMPSQQQIASAMGSGTNDHLDGIEEGNETALNARRWKFASFFNRVKRQVRQHWNPAEEYRQRDPTFRIYGQRDRYTLLRVQLKPDGSLASVALETPSGVEFLDDEAIEAFKQAQPFPNPPRQLVETESGLISFRFGFFFEIGGSSTRFKVFKFDDY